MILVDADFFIGFYSEVDAHHKTCLAFVDKIADELITSYDVIDEVVTKLTYFKKKDKALLFLADIKKTNLATIFPNQKLFEEAKKIFQNKKTSHISFTDCMNVAIAKEKKIKYILSFDKVYEKNGFKLVR